MRTASFGGASAAFAAALALSFGASIAAIGEEPTLKDALMRNQAAAEAALYETTDGGKVFVLDRTREPPLLQFRGAFEVLALRRVAAARGDEILRVDTGDDLVRVTPLGGVTLYPRERPMGVPATRLGPADPLPALAALNLDPNEALGGLRARAGGAEIEAPAASASAGLGTSLLADAFRLTAEGLREASMASGTARGTTSGAASEPSSKGGEAAARLELIQFVYGAGADARIEGDRLVIQVDPSAGYAGRPSSFKIADALADGG